MMQTSREAIVLILTSLTLLQCAHFLEGTVPDDNGSLTTASGDSSGSSGDNSVPDYGDLDDIDTTSTPPPTSTDNGGLNCSESGSGAGGNQNLFSGDCSTPTGSTSTEGSTDSTSTEGSTASTSTEVPATTSIPGDSFTDDTGTTASVPTPEEGPSCMPPTTAPTSIGLEEAPAFNKAFCHSVCLSEVVDRNINSLTREKFLGYPSWTLVYFSYLLSPDDGLNGTDCLLPNNPNGCAIPNSCPVLVNTMLDCKRGCERTTTEDVPDRCDRRCRDECESVCRPNFIPGFGCEVDSIPSPCRTLCRRADCDRGCRDGPRYRGSSVVYDGNPEPILPPNITHISGTRYRVDITDSIPSSTLFNSIGYTTAVVMVTTVDSSKYYVLDMSNEVDFAEFACQRVEISFSISTSRAGKSIFSPPYVTTIRNEEAVAGQFPDQLDQEDENVVQIMTEPDTRVGNLLFHRIHVSWALPANYELATGYTLSLVPSISESCGQVTIKIDNVNITDYVFQRDSNTTSSAVEPPLTQCTYTLMIEVNPRNMLRGDEVFSREVSTGQYGIPSGNNVTMICKNTPDPTRSMYNISIQLQLDSSFTLAVIAGITFFRIHRTEMDSGGNPTTGNGMINDLVLGHIGGSATDIETNGTTSVRSLMPNHAYFFEVLVQWMNNLPRDPEDLPVIRTNCIVNDVPPFPMDAIDSNNIYIESYNITPIRPNLYTVSVYYNFTRAYQGELREDPLRHEIWFDQDVVPDEIVTSLPFIVAPRLSGTVMTTIVTSDETFTVNLQIRTLTDNTVSLWSSPLNFTFYTEETRPEVIADNDFSIVGFRYNTRVNDLGDIEVTIFVDVELLSSAASAGTVVDFQLYIGEEELMTNVTEDNTALVPFSINVDSGGSSMQTLSHTIILPSLDVPAYVQVRGSNLAGVVGYWSSPEVINIRDIPPPPSIIANLRSASVVTRGGDTFLRINMDVGWVSPSLSASPQKRQAPRDPQLEITGYDVIIGVDPVDEPYAEAPPSSTKINIQVSELTSNNAPVNEEIPFIDDDNTTLLLYVQMRSISGGASGSWSEPEVISASTAPADTSQAVIIGVSSLFAILALILLAVILSIIVYFCHRQYKITASIKHDGDGNGMKLWMEDYTDVPYIAPGMVKGKELVVDEWEIPTTDVIVEDHLGEGAFGLVFKGTIRGPLRNPKLACKMRQTVGLQVAVKLLKDTATRKERSDFLVEIDMMKKISEGFCANVVNMVGCVTLQEPLCLITEFLSHGDLLDYLRDQRKKKSTQKREEKYLLLQLEEQRKAYEEMKRKVEILQSAQSDEPGEGRLIASSTGYTDFPDVREGAFNGEQQLLLSSTSMTDPSSFAGTTNSSQVPLAATNALFGPTSPTSITSEVEELGGPSGDTTITTTTTSSGAESESFLKAIPEGEEGTSASNGGIHVFQDKPAPYMESTNEYSHLDPKAEEAEQDIDDELGDLDPNDLIQFAYQIATGMEYLASINIVHRDLACRNILVGDNKSLKITDFGLSRQVEDVYVKTTKGRLPLKWMSLESIEAREFTTYSDVWSYGITLWEIGTLGGFPYPTIQNQDLLMMLKQGYRLEKPDNCAPEVYEIMLECWQEHPYDRPSFTQLRSKFSNLLMAATDDPYMVLEVDENKAIYTMGDEEEEKKLAERAESSSSIDSDASIKKQKNKKIEKPQWAVNTNAYVSTPSTFKADQVQVVDEHFRVPVERAAIDEETSHKTPDINLELGLNPPDDDDDFSASHDNDATATNNSVAAAVNLNLTQPQLAAPSLEDNMGIPLSFLTEKPSQQQQPHSKSEVKKTKSNPYVDDPRTKVLLLEEGEAQKAADHMGSLTTELNGVLRRNTGV